MQGACFKLLIVLLVFAAGGYGILRFFSRLSGVDMVDAMCWGFRQRRELALVLNWFLFYLIGSVFTLFLLTQPYRTLVMHFTHQGALLGHADGAGRAVLYDPARQEYRSYPFINPPPAAERFDEVFEVVAFSRSSQAGQYETLERQSPWIGVFLLFPAALGCAMVYIILFKLAESYGGTAGHDAVLTHRMVLDGFRQATGRPFFTVLAAVPAFVLLTLIIGGFRADGIKRGYREQFAYRQQDLREEVMAAVAPGKVLKGRPVPAEVRDRSGDLSGRVIAAPGLTGSVEFPGLVKYLPVYLRMAPADRILLERSFAQGAGGENGPSPDGDRRAEQGAVQEQDFVVNDDYSVSLIAPDARSNN